MNREFVPEDASLDVVNSCVRDFFQGLVIERNDRVVLTSVLQSVMNVFFREGDPESGFELGGSACIGGLWYGSDIDLRYKGSDLPMFFEIVSRFVSLVGAENDFFWTGRLLTINVLQSAIKVDILIVGDVFDLMRISPNHISDGVCFKLVNLYNIQHARIARSDVRHDFVYDATKTAAFERVYLLVNNDPAWHSFFILLKSIDTTVPSCMLAVMVGLAAYTHSYMARGTDQWRFGFEIVNRFLRAFGPFQLLDEGCDVDGLNESFFNNIWTPFVKLAFPDVLNDMVNHMATLFTRRQLEKLQSSCLGVVICELSYPAVPSCTPVYSSPRSLSPYIVHHAVDYIIASFCYSEMELRQSAEVPHGLHQLTMAAAATWGDCELANWVTFQGMGKNITLAVLTELAKFVANFL